MKLVCLACGRELEISSREGIYYLVGLLATSALTGLWLVSNGVHFSIGI
jgi:hypothetical protein